MYIVSTTCRERGGVYSITGREGGGVYIVSQVGKVGGGV